MKEKQFLFVIIRVVKTSPYDAEKNTDLLSDQHEYMGWRCEGRLLETNPRLIYLNYNTNRNSFHQMLYKGTNYRSKGVDTHVSRGCNKFPEL